MDFELLKTLCAIPAAPGDEGRMRDFILTYFKTYQDKFSVKPEIFSGDGFQDTVIAIFGKPRLGLFAHMDTVSYIVAYDNNLVKMGNPLAESGAELVGIDSHGEVRCKLVVTKAKPSRAKNSKTPALPTYHYKASRKIDRGTLLTYAPNFKETKNYVQTPYLDNRLGVWNLLNQAHTMTAGALVFTTYEEVGGGTAQATGRFLQEKYGIKQAIISDVTLMSDHIKQNLGVAITLRDRGIARRAFVDKVIGIAIKTGVKFQLEVETAGGSDGNVLHDSPYFWDWCFVGPPESNYHTPGEKVHKADIQAMIELYAHLLKEL